MKKIACLALTTLVLMLLMVGCGVDGDPSHVVVDNAAAFPAGGGGLSQEEVDDYVAALINDADSVHTRISIAYDDADNAYDFIVDDMNDDTPDNDGEVPDAITVNAQAGSTWNLADTVTALSVYTGGTSLDETTAANDSGGYIVGLFDEFAMSNGTNVQDVVDDIDDALSNAQIFLTAGAGVPTTSNGCAAAAQTEEAVNDINYYTLDYDNTADEKAQWSFAMPSDWDAGTITAQVYWTTVSGGAAETIEFEISGGCWGNDDALDAALGAAQTCTDTWIADSDLHITAASAAITIANAAAGEWTVIQAMRDVSGDDLGGDCQLIGIMINYGRN